MANLIGFSYKERRSSKAENMLQRNLRFHSLLFSPNSVLFCLALFKLLLHLFAKQYGYHRDELYYIAASKQLDFGYVDSPPFIALVTALIRWLFGDSLFALHFFPAVAGALVVLLTGLLARELGAGLFAQALAAIAVLIAPVYLGINSLLTVDAFGLLWWTLGAYIIFRLLKKGSTKLWIFFGLVAGVGLMTKVTILYFGFGIVIGLLLTPERKYLANILQNISVVWKATQQQSRKDIK